MFSYTIVFVTHLHRYNYISNWCIDEFHFKILQFKRFSGCCWLAGGCGVGGGHTSGLPPELCIAPLRPCAKRLYPEEGPEGGAAWNGDVGLEWGSECSGSETGRERKLTPGRDGKERECCSPVLWDGACAFYAESGVILRGGGSEKEPTNFEKIKTGVWRKSKQSETTTERNPDVRRDPNVSRHYLQFHSSTFCRQWVTSALSLTVN